jgi:F-type H+-transporting ATPase subunit gamma
MPNLQHIRRRIASVRSTQKITRAMKMVAAAKLRRAQEAIMNARPYAYHMRELTNGLAVYADRESHPLLHPGVGSKVVILVVSSDRGLCGSFNTNIVNETMRILREQFKDREVELTLIGRKGVEALRRRPCTIRTTHVGVYERFTVNAAARIIDDAVAEFTKGEAGEVYCLYNEFKSAITHRVALERLLPYEMPAQDVAAGEINYIYEPSARKILFSLLVRNMHVQMYRILLESAASEQGARMTAMESATKNAGEVIGRLTLKYNRARQDAITREVIEVISGSETL